MRRLQARFTAAPIVLERLSSDLEADRLAARRKAVKRLEKLDLETLPAQVKAALRKARGWRDWRDSLRRQNRLARSWRADCARARDGGVFSQPRAQRACGAQAVPVHARTRTARPRVWRGRAAVPPPESGPKRRSASIHDLEVALKEHLADQEPAGSPDARRARRADPVHPGRDPIATPRSWRAARTSWRSATDCERHTSGEPHHG